MRLFCRCPTPSESCRLVLSTQQKFLAASQFLVPRRGEEKTFALNTRSCQGTVSFNFSSLLSFAMKRKQKRFLQMTLLFMVALIFLPNVGLWSLYKDKHLVKSTEPGEQQVSATQRKIAREPVRHAIGPLGTWEAGEGQACPYRADITRLRDCSCFKILVNDIVKCKVN